MTKKSYFDFLSIFIGVVLGMIIILIIVWIAYYSKTFIFSYCASTTRPCGFADYYNDPGVALAQNINLTPEDILFVKDDEMFYNRVLKNTDCAPQSNKITYIKYPQYCEFSSNSSSGTWRQTALFSNLYKPVGFTGPTITTSGNCQPNPGTGFTEGIPIIRWDIGI